MIIKEQLGKIISKCICIQLNISSNLLNRLFILGIVEKNAVENPAKRTKISELPKSSDFSIECVRMERDDFCIACKQKFVVSNIRIMHVEYCTDLTVENFSFGGKALWYHVLCFARLRSQIGWLQSAEMLPGFKRLTEHDKEMVKKQIP